MQPNIFVPEGMLFCLVKHVITMQNSNMSEIYNELVIMLFHGHWWAIVWNARVTVKKDPFRNISNCFLVRYVVYHMFTIWKSRSSINTFSRIKIVYYLYLPYSQCRKCEKSFMVKLSHLTFIIFILEGVVYAWLCWKITCLNSYAYDNWRVKCAIT